ncbi:MAG: hypothetical protein Q7S42_02415 [Candidatus Omnitrophota bacterium]|nr:hypothetical protein [Candidatus Omnitrophota bacterium]
MEFFDEGQLKILGKIVFVLISIFVVAAVITMILEHFKINPFPKSDRPFYPPSIHSGAG